MDFIYRRSTRVIAPREDGPGVWGLLGEWSVGPLRALGIERAPSPRDSRALRSIPPGRHRVQVATMDRLRWECLRLVDWPESDAPGERDHFVLHPGSWPDDFFGCLGAGATLLHENGALAGVGRTRDTCAELMRYIKAQAPTGIWLVVEGEIPTLSP